MYMTPKGTPDPEYPTSNSRKGNRKDKKNLIDVWLNAKPVWLMNNNLIYYLPFYGLLLLSDRYDLGFFFQNKKSVYVWHKKKFDEINVKTTDRLMGGYTSHLCCLSLTIIFYLYSHLNPLHLGCKTNFNKHYQLQLQRYSLKGHFLLW